MPYTIPDHRYTVTRKADGAYLGHLFTENLPHARLDADEHFAHFAGEPLIVRHNTDACESCSRQSR